MPSTGKARPSVQMSIAERLAAKEKERAKKLEALATVVDAKAELQRKKDEKRRQEEDREAALRAQAESDAAYQLELAREAEIKRKTKDYWKLDHLNERVLLAPHFPGYYGEHLGDRGAWVPHGKGEFRHKHEVILEGTFRKGIIHGDGVLRLENGCIWEGEFKNGKIHGVGFWTNEKGVKREAVARNHVVICYKDELLDGKQVEIDDPTLRMVAPPLTGNKILATIMFHVRGWKYRCRFHEEVRPRERDVVFSSLKTFKILHNLPQIYHLNSFGFEVDATPRYDYWSDVYGQAHKGKGPKLGIAGGRRTAEMRPFQAEPLKPIARTSTKTDYRENVYESGMVGIGAAQEEEEVERRREMKRKQFQALIDKRRADAEAERLKTIEEEQKRLAEEDIAKNKAKAAEAAAAKLKHEQDLKEALERAATEYDAANPE